MALALAIVACLCGAAIIVWGAETFTENLGVAAVQLNVSRFALALLLAGAEPEELATAVTASYRGAPGIALGDVIGANVAICLVALAVGALISPLPFTKRVQRYALWGLPLGAIATWFAWDAIVSRLESALLVGLYAIYISVIWHIEKHAPSLGEVDVLEKAKESLRVSGIGRELLLVFLGIGAMAVGAMMLVESIRRIAPAESSQTALGLTLVGFATAFELVVLAWSAARRGITEAVIAAVVGSYAYNVTMTLGAGGLVRPLVLNRAALLHRPLIVMNGALLLVIVLTRRGLLTRNGGFALLAGYFAFLATVLVARF